MINQSSRIWIPRSPSRVLSLAAAGAVGTAAFAAGGVLTAFSTRFSDAAPWVLVATAVLPLLVLGVLVNPLLGALAVFLTFPFGDTAAPLGPFTLQAAEGAVVFIALIVVLRRLATGRTPLPWVWPLGWALGLITWMLISFFGAVSHSLAIKALISTIGAVVFACVIVAVVRDVADVRWILGAFMVACAIIAVLGLSSGSHLSQANYGGAGEVVSGRLSTAFSSPNQLGSLAAMAFGVSVAIMLATRRPLARFAAVVVTALVLAALGLSLSRGAWIGTAIAFVFMFLTMKEARRLVAAFALPVALVGALVYTYARPNAPEIQVINARAQALTKLSPYDNRNDIWREAIREIKAHPVVGVGPGGFPVASERSGSEASTVFAEHAHNLWLNTAAEEGLPADFFLLGFIGALGAAVIATGRSLRRRGRPDDRVVVYGVAAGLVALLGQEMVDHTLSNPVVRIAAWGLVGCLLAAYRVTAGAERQGDPTR